jgi:hypothetical protein
MLCLWESYKKKIWKQLFCFASLKSMKKGIGSGSGSISQRYGSSPKCPLYVHFERSVSFLLQILKQSKPKTTLIVICIFLTIHYSDYYMYTIEPVFVDLLRSPRIDSPPSLAESIPALFKLLQIRARSLYL